MKTLYMIGGTMGVGKTTVCQQLKQDLPNSVFLDGDWCWDANPFQVTDETKAMVTNNICYLLNNFLKCSAYENIIFCWVMHEQSIIDSILEKLDTQNCEVKCISLVADEKTLCERLSMEAGTEVVACVRMDCHWDNLVACHTLHFLYGNDTSRTELTSCTSHFFKHDTLCRLERKVLDRTASEVDALVESNLDSKVILLAH